MTPPPLTHTHPDHSPDLRPPPLTPDGSRNAQTHTAERFFFPLPLSSSASRLLRQETSVSTPPPPLGLLFPLSLPLYPSILCFCFSLTFTALLTLPVCFSLPLLPSPTAVTLPCFNGANEFLYSHQSFKKNECNKYKFSFIVLTFNLSLPLAPVAKKQTGLHTVLCNGSMLGAIGEGLMRKKTVVGVLES